MRQNSSELYLLDGNQLLLHDVVIHNKFADRMALPAMDHSSFCPISFDGTVLEYRGSNG